MFAVRRKGVGAAEKARLRELHTDFGQGEIDRLAEPKRPHATTSRPSNTSSAIGSSS
jgi:hypothetical protein